MPLVSGGRVFISGAEGMLHALDVATGKKIWARDLAAEYEAGKGFFGRATSPLLSGSTLVVQVGGDAAGLVGLDAATGEQRWAATDHEAGYASPITAEIGGRQGGAGLHA